MTRGYVLVDWETGLAPEEKNMVNLHFEIKPNGRVIIESKEGDTKLVFGKEYKQGRGRKVSAIENVGKAFLKIAAKAKELGYYQ